MTVEEISRLVSGKPDGDRNRKIQGIAALESAGAEELAFAEGSQALAKAAQSKAGCILVPEGCTLTGRTTIAVARPKLAMILAAEALHAAPARQAGIHSSAVVSGDARLADGVSVGAHAVIEEGVNVAAGSILGSGVFLGRGVQVGSCCVLHPNVTVYSGARIGDRVVIHSGSVIGSDGFGYVFAEGRHYKFPQLGHVIIEADVEIGANTTVDRGSLGTTIVGQGTKIDNLVQIAHNVRIGRHCVIAAQTGISGSVEIGDYVVMGGQVGVGDKVRIEERAVIGAQAGIPTGKIVRRGSAMWGTPARPMSEFKKTYAHLSNLPRLAQKMKEVSRHLATLAAEAKRG